MITTRIEPALKHRLEDLLLQAEYGTLTGDPGALAALFHLAALHLPADRTERAHALAEYYDDEAATWERWDRLPMLAAEEHE